MKRTESGVRASFSRIARLLSLAGFASVALALPAPAAAWDGYVNGTITGFDSIANEAGNYELRIYINNATTYCTGPGPQFAYLNSADVNFKGVLATLMTAYSLGKTVGIYMLNDGNMGCHIHYVAVR